MKKLKVDLGDRSYEIIIGAGLLPGVGRYLKEMGLGGKAAVITDSNVRALYANTVEVGLKNAGFRVAVLEVPAGEENKTLETAGRLYGELTDFRAERSTPVLALGGGMVGDLAGFVAATYLRGVPLVQLPTTLLAQVDSSVGGKTAVDHGRLKNIVGTFYQPRLVLADTDTLRTLPEIEISNGLGEVIKHAVIRDRAFFEFLEANMERVRALDPAVIEETVLRNVAIKAGIVARDEREQGLRSLLNFGHTVGHAVESVSGFDLKHGQAVAIGMIAAAEISNRMGKLGADGVARLKRLVEAVGLPAQVTDLDRRKVMEAISHDKKVINNKVRFILLKAIGEAFVSNEVDPTLVEEVVFGHE